jgi:hypothetical protein
MLTWITVKSATPAVTPCVPRLARAVSRHMCLRLWLALLRSLVCFNSRTLQSRYRQHCPEPISRPALYLRSSSPGQGSRRAGLVSAFNRCGSTADAFNGCGSPAQQTSITHRRKERSVPGMFLFSVCGPRYKSVPASLIVYNSDIPAVRSAKTTFGECCAPEDERKIRFIVRRGRLPS